MHTAHSDSHTGHHLWPSYDGPQDLAGVESMPLDERPVPTSTYALLTEAARARPDQTALVLLSSAEQWRDATRWTFADLSRHVHRIANTFTAHGAGRSEAVAFLCANTGLTLAAMLAAEAVAIAAPINPALAQDKTLSLLILTKARTLVASGPELDPDTWDKARILAEQAGIDTLFALRPENAQGPAPDLAPLPGTTLAYLEDAMDNRPAEHLESSVPGPDDIAAYFHTGGTTGAPKIAVHTHANQATMAWTLALGAEIPEGATILAGLPLFHVNALLITGLAPLLRGQRVLWVGPQGYRDPHLYGNFWKIVEHHRVAAMSAVPTVYAVLNAFAVDADISTLTLPVVGAAPLPPSVRAAFQEHTGLELVEGYGLSEATCASARGWAGAHRPGSVGQRLPYQHIKAVHIDPDTGTWKDLPPGTSGTLAISGPTVFAGYLRPGPDGPVPDPADKAVDGWLDTGDIGYVDEDGFVYLVGRAKDLIIRGGHNIDPATIEEALLAHPDVTGASAVGRPDRHSGELPVAYVTVAPGSSTTEADLMLWASEQVGEKAAVPKSVHVIDALPVTEVGKQYKPALREDAARQLVERELDERGIIVGPGGVSATHRTGRLTVNIDVEDAAALDSALDGYTFTWVAVGRSSTGH